MKTLLIMITLNLISFAMAEEHIMKTASEIVWQDGPKALPAGAQFAILEGDPAKQGPLTMRLKLPPNYKIMPHWHPAIEHVTVLEGEFMMGAGTKFDEAKAKSLPVGSFAVMPIKFNHYALTGKKPTVVQVHAIGPWDIIYIDPKDDPRKQKK